MGIMGINEINSHSKMWMKKYRWIIRSFGDTGDLLNYKKGSLCTVSARPKISFEKQEIRHVQETASYHGRPSWEPIDLTIFNVAGDRSIYDWLKKHYNPETEEWGYRNEAIIDIGLTLYNGVGQIIEEWKLEECYASSIDWGELDYSSTEFATCMITIEYTRAKLLISQNTGGRAGQNS